MMFSRHLATIKATVVLRSCATYVFNVEAITIRIGFWGFLTILIV